MKELFENMKDGVVTLLSVIMMLGLWGLSLIIPVAIIKVIWEWL